MLKIAHSVNIEDDEEHLSIDLLLYASANDPGKVVYFEQDYQIISCSKSQAKQLIQELTDFFDL